MKHKNLKLQASNHQVSILTDFDLDKYDFLNFLIENLIFV